MGEIMMTGQETGETAVNIWDGIDMGTAGQAVNMEEASSEIQEHPESLEPPPEQCPECNAFYGCVVSIEDPFRNAPGLSTESEFGIGMGSGGDTEVKSGGGCKPVGFTLAALFFLVGAILSIFGLFLFLIFKPFACIAGCVCPGGCCLKCLDSLLGGAVCILWIPVTIGKKIVSCCPC